MIPAKEFPKCSSLVAKDTPSICIHVISALDPNALEGLSNELTFISEKAKTRAMVCVTQVPWYTTMERDTMLMLRAKMRERSHTLGMEVPDPSSLQYLQFGPLAAILDSCPCFMLRAMFDEVDTYAARCIISEAVKAALTPADKKWHFVLYFPEHFLDNTVGDLKCQLLQ